MRPLSIRVRLAFWYFAVLLATLALFSLVAFQAIRHSMIAAIDEELHYRVLGFQGFLSKNAGDRDFLETFLAHVGEDDLIQLSDENDNWLYRSQQMEALGLSMQRVPPGEFQYRDISVHGGRFRLVTATFRIGNSNYRVQVAESLARFDTTLRKISNLLWFLVPAILLASTIGGYWLSRRAMEPVDAITNRARAISPMSLSDRLPVPKSRDELQRLALTLNEMLERIESAFRRITQFTADASHELRAPLALIRATAEVGSRRTRKEEEYREAFTRIVTETERTTDLVESLLTLARADTGAVGLTKEELDLGEMLQEAYVRGRTMAEAKGLSLVADVRKPLWINGNTESIQRLLLIIIDNAVKYTSAGGKVSLAASAEDHYAIVKVADTGVGISEEDLPHVFERFYRADKARNRTERGTGLGLAIAKWIIEAHEGSIVCRSKVGAGSTFEIRIPLAGRQP